METILRKLGYLSPNAKANQNIKEIELLFINNSDGSIRWVWNANCSKPLFLKFYNVGSIRAHLFSVIIQVVFILKLQRFVFHKKSFFYTIADTPIFECTKDWSLFMGTIGLNNKAILYSNNLFYKIATTKNARKMIATERKVLEKVELKKTNFIIPKVTYVSKDIIQLTDISSNGKRPTKFTPEHFYTIIETSYIQGRKTKIGQWELFNSLKINFENDTDNRIPKNIIRKINTLIKNCDPAQEIETHLSHGDFTQWNMYKTKDNSIAVYDWELASYHRPKGYDYFHYILQQGILVERKSWKLIYKDLLAYSNNKFGDSFFEKNINEYLKWYLLTNCLYNMQIYANQIKWYKQIYWMFEVWNEALNVFLQDQYNQRELIIMDLFDLLESQEYATLKFPKGHPELLSINSDIDLVIDKKLNQAIVKYLQNHSLVSKVTSNQKSFMNTIQVFLLDGNILSIDLLWQLKVKNYVILNAKEIIASNYKNNYGVKSASEIDTARFIILFYLLNGASIPARYTAYKKVIENSNGSLDFVLRAYFNRGNHNPGHIYSFMKYKKENRHFSFIKNTSNYFCDTVKDNDRGFIITFSGVDGAGKSTVIDQLANRIEKQLRKPVVILRHRPSILPILSVWTKGKLQAHQDAINNLPRQGKNRNLISSFLRFSYYYTDYFIGQFVIYCKYVLRGYVVLYDRYYFDFVNDSKRSNIILSKKISLFGYLFLLKPKFNFFLFADVSVILNRKKELSKTTIEQLTKDYKKLFGKLNSKSDSTIYECINNVDIGVTLDHIIKTIIQHKK
jgi:thymidylate kinase